MCITVEYKTEEEKTMATMNIFLNRARLLTSHHSKQLKQLFDILSLLLLAYLAWPLLSILSPSFLVTSVSATSVSRTDDFSLSLTGFHKEPQFL